ncbi:hypothetical protein AKUH4B410M_09130 [Apilactobacillus kunkeei]|nr:hypothetical protein AKUH4B405J_09130 [Apilactobacillus kunkeei]CAI2616360.1 hypothetical protein AKUH4B410M_09130 [Apilactobacillus kunkeei]CAI2617229.1 hypothetical protein AKUH4B102A_09400 [Apilactobacillus kunkeei]CAI2618142.1 hypothetical protein AKUH4B210M_09270 [Apilactobacillus kunkeei]CAI2683131.1 hypothetical protein AKUH3B102X_09120 [Apilactobacillus kunkeei]
MKTLSSEKIAKKLVNRTNENIDKYCKALIKALKVSK